MQRLLYFTTEKKVGETPLVALERGRLAHGIPSDIPLAYAGRLDPMASGKLLILVGEECKVQEKYHAFQKEYKVELLFGIASDSGDVLGITTAHTPTTISDEAIRTLFSKLRGPIELPYPHFSSKTIQGKPLHTWALESRLNEIEIPIKKSTILKLVFNELKTVSKSDLLKSVSAKIETIPPVTDARKALGQDFRRTDVRASWSKIEENPTLEYQILSFTCIASSGTYMRSLGEHIAESLGTHGLAYSIHRTKMGSYLPIWKNYGLWIKQF